MNTRILMSISAVFLAMLGAGVTFMPQEFLSLVDAPSEAVSVLLLQLLGASYLGFAALNWMNKGNRIGGIYFRPVSMANFFNFSVGSISLVKWIISNELLPELGVIALFYSVFAVWFGIVMFSRLGDAAQSS